MSALSNCLTTVWALNATTIAGSPDGVSGFNSTLLNEPIDMVGTNDSIYVLDYGASYFRIQLFYPNSQLRTIIFNITQGTSLNQLSSITALNRDVGGNIYILDNGNARVSKWVPGASTGVVVA
ncbi:unnamed protein product, partial [Adineta steineri]